MKERSGSRTLLMSVLMSAPGPLVVGLGLLVGKSSTQLADFCRRSAELLAIIVAFVVYQLAGNDEDPQKKARLERGSNLFVGAAMCLSGGIMLFLALFSGSSEKGNVIPGLAIALLGVIANSLFWRKCTGQKQWWTAAWSSPCPPCCCCPARHCPQSWTFWARPSFRCTCCGAA